MHIYASANMAFVDSDNGLSFVRCQVIIWTKANSLSNEPFGTNCKNIFQNTKIHIQGKWNKNVISNSFCFGQNPVRLQSTTLIRIFALWTQSETKPSNPAEILYANTSPYLNRFLSAYRLTLKRLFILCNIYTSESLFDSDHSEIHFNSDQGQGFDGVVFIYHTLHSSIQGISTRSHFPNRYGPDFVIYQTDLC